MCYTTNITAADCGHTIRTSFSKCLPMEVLSRNYKMTLVQRFQNAFKPKQCPPKDIKTRVCISQVIKLCPACETLAPERPQPADENVLLFGKKRVTSMIDFRNQRVGPFDYAKFKDPVCRQGGTFHPLSYDEARSLFWCLRCRQQKVNRPDTGPRSKILGLCCDHPETKQEWKEFLAKKSTHGLPDDSPPNTPQSTPDQSRESSRDYSAQILATPTYKPYRPPGLIVCGERNWEPVPTTPPSVTKQPQTTPTEAPKQTAPQAPIPTTRPRGNTGPVCRQQRPSRNSPPFRLATGHELRQELDQVNCAWRSVLDAKREHPSSYLYEEDRRLWLLRCDLRTQLNLPYIARDRVVRREAG